MALSNCSKSGVLHVSFNQDCTCVALGSQQGVHIYNVDTHKLCYRYAIGAVSIVEMLFCTSLVGFVGAGEQPALTPRKLTVMNTSSSRVIQELSYPTSVLAVRMNRQRLVVVTSRRAHVYSMTNLACLRVIDTEESSRGCCALTSCHEPNLLALPASSTTGTVRMYDLTQEGGNVLSEVQAHQSPVTTLAWNAEGTLLATASAKGTLIRVHRMPSAARSHSFRRGATSATIQSLAFGPGGLPVQLLAACSSHGTVHVFRLEEPAPPGVLHRPSSAAAGLLSAMVRYSVGDMVEPARNIATIRFPRSGGAAICAFRSGPLPVASLSVPPAAAADTDAAAGPVAASIPLGSGVDPDRGAPPTELAAGGSCAAPSTAAAAAATKAATDRAGEAVRMGLRSGTGGLGEWSGVAAVEGILGSGEEARATIMVAVQEGLLYEYSLADLRDPQGPKCTLDGEWSLLGSGSVLG